MWTGSYWRFSALGGFQLFNVTYIKSYQRVAKALSTCDPVWAKKCIDVASDVGVNLCNVKSCLNTSNNEIFTDKRGDLPCVNISKHTCTVVK